MAAAINIPHPLSQVTAVLFPTTTPSSAAGNGIAEQRFGDGLGVSFCIAEKLRLIRPF
jgi:hypothetical protein